MQSIQTICCGGVHVDTKPFALLTDYLKTTNKNPVNLPLKEIEQIIGMKLPNRSSRKPQWWSNYGSSPQARGWLDAGYEVRESELIPIRRGVSFWKIEDEKKYSGLKAFFLGNKGKVFAILSAIALIIGIVADFTGFLGFLSLKRRQVLGLRLTT
jgi:hypothetical protein